MYTAYDSTLLIVDMQGRLMPVIDAADAVTATAAKLAAAAYMLEVPVVATEQNSRMLGVTVEPLRASVRSVFQKMHFSAVAESGFDSWLPNARSTIFVAGCETHICVLQTVLGLQAAGRRAVLVADACGSRRAGDKDAALNRARTHGVDIVTAEMAIFEWMGSCEHPRFRDVLRIVK